MTAIISRKIMISTKVSLGWGVYFLDRLLVWVSLCLSVLLVCFQDATQSLTFLVFLITIDDTIIRAFTESEQPYFASWLLLLLGQKLPLYGKGSGSFRGPCLSSLRGLAFLPFQKLFVGLRNGP